MSVQRGTILWTGLLAALLASTASLSAGDRDCPPKTCCPQPTSKTISTTVYGETVADVCFPPTLCMRLKKCLGLVPDGGCDGCSGAPRPVHRLTTRIITEEKCSVTYEPVSPYPHGCLSPRQRPPAASGAVKSAE
jgi:hypothetical protein